VAINVLNALNSAFSSVQNNRTERGATLLERSLDDAASRGSSSRSSTWGTGNGTGTGTGSGTRVGAATTMQIASRAVRAGTMGKQEEPAVVQRTGPSNADGAAALMQHGYSAGVTKQIIDATKQFVQTQGSDPASGFGRVVKNNQLTLLGEAHDQNGRFLTSALAKSAIRNGANVIFVETGTENQAALTRFMRTGEPADLPRAFGVVKPGDKPHIYNADYIKAMQHARAHGVKLVAVDSPNSLKRSVQDRNQTMASNISSYFAKNPDAKGVFIVGQGHMDGARRSVPVQTMLGNMGVKTAQVYRESNDDLRISKHKVPYAQDAATTVVLQVNGNKPVMLPTKNNLLESALPNKHPGNPTNTFIIHYPYVNLP
jgi:uncharacterized iron-regulated protein